MFSSVPRPVITLLGVVVVMALIPSILPALVGMLLADANVVLAQAQRVMLPVAMTAGVLAGVVHVSPLHRVHAIALFEGSLVGLTVVALVPALYPWLAIHLPMWLAAVSRALGG